MTLENYMKLMYLLQQTRRALIGIALMSCPLGLFSQLTLSDSLIAYYPMDGNAQDLSGNGNHGTPMNGTSLTADRFGNPNSAYQFDGVDDYIELLPNSANFKSPLPLSVAFWIYLSGNANHFPFNNDEAEDIYEGLFIGFSSQVGINIGDGGSPGPFSRRSKLGTTALALGTWYHLALIVRGPLDMDIYINGKQDCGTYHGTGGPMVYSASNSGNLGRADTNNGQTTPWHHLFGILDELRYYNRALTVAEIRELADVTQNPDTICAGDTLQLDAGFGTSFAWTGPDLSCTNCSEPFASPTTTTTYLVTTENTPGCSDTLSRTVVVDNNCTDCDMLAISASFTAVSTNYSVNYQDFSAGSIDSLLWILGDGTDTTTLPSAIFTYTYSIADTFEACLIAYSSVSEDSICADTSCIPVITTIESVCDTTSLTADFTYSVNGLNVSFSDASFGTDVDQISWNLDGVTWVQDTMGSTTNFTYPNGGVYPVCIEAVDWYGDSLACRDTFCTTVDIRTEANASFLTDDQWQIFPNPMKEGFWVQNKGEKPFEVELFDARGKICFATAQAHVGLIWIPAHTLSQGMYLLKIHVEGKTGWKKVILE